MSELVFIETDEQIASCFQVFQALRPHLQSVEMFVAQVKRQQLQSYRIMAVQEEGGAIVSAAGFRMGEYLAWGKILYVDDLSTLPSVRGKGHASVLLDGLKGYARAEGCAGLHLDSGYTRLDAHRLYLNKGLQLACHHFSIDL
ncbi:GNAT family N-acetyltransferase [Kiritimatiellaeota bacterium B1221]|nr:GNAT family N-acetyltransferase [Kiritimatiellaeota bacterium B1221]